MNTQLKRYCLSLVLSALCFTFSACGSGGGSSPSRTTKLKTSMKTVGLTTGIVPSGYVVSTIDLILALPYGVTVELDPDTNLPAKSVSQLVGTTDPSMGLNTLDYVAPTISSPGSLRITYVAAAGFTPADSIDVTLDITSGFSPVATDFSLTKYDIGVMKLDPLTGSILDTQSISIPTPNDFLKVGLI